jgi:GT2 family glycosyltransferase
MRSPLFSIIITTVDRPQLLQDAARSVLGQSLPDFELIVVNDGGPDLDPLLENLDPLHRVAQLRLPGRSGPGRARNAGIRRAVGQFLCFLDDDDLYHPDHLATLHRELVISPDALVYADAVVHHEIIDGSTRRIVNSAAPWQHELFIKQRLWIHNFIPVQVFAVRREALLAVGGFDEELRAFEDWDLLLKLAAHQDFIHIPRVTSEIRMRPQSGAHRSQSVKTDRSEPEIIEQLYARHGDLGDPLIRAGRAFVRGNGFASGPDFLIVDTSETDLAYRAWLPHHTPDTAALAHAPDSMLLIVIAPAGHESWLAATTASFAALPDNCRLVVVGEAPLRQSIATLPAGHDSRRSLRPVATLDDFVGLTTALNEIIAEAGEKWVAILPAGATLDASTGSLLAACAAVDERRRAIYCDHDQAILPQDIRARPSFKPDFDPELLCAQDYIGPALWIRRDELLALGPLQPFPDNWLHDALWRLYDRAGAAAIGHLTEPLLHLPVGGVDSPLALAARQAVVEQHLARAGQGGRVGAGPVAGSFAIDYPLPAPAPRLSLIVWADGDGADAAARCLNSLLRRAAYPDLEIIDATGTVALDGALTTLSALAATRGATIWQLPPATDANTSAAAKMNAAAQLASGDYLLFLRASTENLQPNWLSALVQQAARPGIGAVGARLIGPDGKLVAGATVLGLQGCAATAFLGMPYQAPGYLNRAQLAQSVSAISRRCLMLRSETFAAVGGFNAASYPDAHADTDLCLRLGERGLSILWQPATLVADHAPAECLEATAACAHLQRDWGNRLAADPAHNRNLSRQRTDLAVPCLPTE